MVRFHHAPPNMESRGAGHQATWKVVPLLIAVTVRFCYFPPNTLTRTVKYYIIVHATVSGIWQTSRLTHS